MSKRCRVSFALALSFFLFTTVLGQNKADRIAEINNEGGSVSWRVFVPHESVTLTVSAPDGSVFRREFKAGSTPEYTPVNSSGEFYGNGSFTYELVITPVIAPDVKAELAAAREHGKSDAVAVELRKSGDLPSITSESGSFALVNGQIFSREDGLLEGQEPGSEGEPEKRQPRRDTKVPDNSAGDVPTDDLTVINMDLVVQGSECLGIDCPSNPSFGFDTLRLQENNLRIKFQDTSTSASFPTTDWEITINDSSNGGQARFSVLDVDASRNPFTIENNAASNSLYVDGGNSGRIGFKTATPVVELHVRDGDTPTLRLEQDGSSGFTPQTFDIAGNEANFFVRDVTNGSRLVFKIKPGAPTSSIFVQNNGRVGLGTESPSAQLDVRNPGGDLGLFVTEEATPSTPLTTNGNDVAVFQNDGPSRVVLANTSAANNATNQQRWVLNSNGTFRIGAGDALTPFTLAADGDVTITGSLTTATMNYPDFVFKNDYSLMTLEELRAFIEREGHLPNIPSEAEINANGGKVNMSKMQMLLLQKIEELTLYTLAQQKALDAREKEAREMKAEIEALKNAKLSP